MWRVRIECCARRIRHTQLILCYAPLVVYPFLPEDSWWWNGYTSSIEVKASIYFVPCRAAATRFVTITLRSGHNQDAWMLSCSDLTASFSR